MEEGWVVGQQNADIADTVHLREIVATIFVFLYMGCTLAPPGEYDWAVVYGGDAATLCQITLTTCFLARPLFKCYNATTACNFQCSADNKLVQLVQRRDIS